MLEKIRIAAQRLPASTDMTAVGGRDSRCEVLFQERNDTTWHDESGQVRVREASE